MKDIWITENQIKHEDAIRKAVRQNATIAILDYPGTGFKFSLNRVCQLTGGIRMALVQIALRSKQKEIGVNMLKQIACIRFNNFKSGSVSVFDLIRVIGTRVRQDLKGKKILLVFEQVDYLRKPEKLSDFMDLLDNINFPCGVILRFEPSYILRVQGWGDQKLYTRFEKLTFLRKVTRPNQPSEIREMLMLHGLTNPNLLNEISLNTESFTIAKLKLDKKALFRPTNQLNLFSENRLRV